MFGVFGRSVYFWLGRHRTSTRKLKTRGHHVNTMSASLKPASGELRAMHLELSTEIAVLAKAEPSDSDRATRFPDPAKLSQLERRLLTRSVFSYVEAMCFSLKQWALSSHRAGNLTNAERALAAEESYELADNGCPVVRTAKLRLLANIRFAFHVAAKARNVSFALDASGRGWQALQRSHGVRDRLMHPKRTSDLTVKDAEARDVLGAFIWFSAQIVSLLLEIVAANEAEIAALRAHSKTMKSALFRRRASRE